MTGPGKRDLGYWQVWVVTIVPRAGPAKWKSGARKEGEWEVLRAYSKAQGKLLFLPCFLSSEKLEVRGF